MKQRTSSRDIGNGLYLYFLGLSTRNVSKALSFLNIIKRSHHVAIWNWIQKYPPKRISSPTNKIDELIVDEAVINVGSEPTWLWVAIDSKNKRILVQCISKDRNMFVAERFLSKAIEEYGKHPVSTDGGTWYPPQAHRFLKLHHHLHSSLEKSSIERTIQYVKDRTENFDDYFPCRKKNCKLNHVNNWLNLIAQHYNKGISV